MSPRWLQHLAFGAAALALGIAMLAARVVWSSHREWRAATLAIAAPDRLAHLGAAARLYAPGNPWSEQALDELVKMGEQSQAPATARLAAWRQVRSAIWATRSFYTRRPALLARADREIAGLAAGLEAATPGEPPSSLAARTDWHRARLAERTAPAVGWTLVALFGLVAWLAGAFGFALAGVDVQDRLRRRPALACALGVALGMALFFVGLGRA